jgi:hypothetical protein
VKNTKEINIVAVQSVNNQCPLIKNKLVTYDTCLKCCFAGEEKLYGVSNGVAQEVKIECLFHETKHTKDSIYKTVTVCSIDSQATKEEK